MCEPDQKGIPPANRLTFIIVPKTPLLNRWVGSCGHRRRFSSGRKARRKGKLDWKLTKRTPNVPAYKGYVEASQCPQVREKKRCDSFGVRGDQATVIQKKTVGRPNSGRTKERGGFVFN